MWLGLGVEPAMVAWPAVVQEHGGCRQASRPIPRCLLAAGESDVIEGTNAKVYEERLRTIADDAAKEWGFRPPWLLAKSTHHPTVYNKPVEEAAIREAVKKLSGQPGFRLGPDTDILGGVGVYRGGQGTQRHFTSEGQRMAGLLWFAAIWQELQHPSP